MGEMGRAVQRRDLFALWNARYSAFVVGVAVIQLIAAFLAGCLAGGLVVVLIMCARVRVGE